MARSSTAAALPEAAPLPDDRSLRRIAQLAASQEQLEAWIASYEEVTNAMKQSLKVICERELPDAMGAAGLDEFRMKDGRKVTIRTVYSAGIRTEWPPENRERGFQYLIANGAGALIRHDIAVTFGHGDSKPANSLLRYLRKQGWLSRFGVNDRTWVHAGQLGAWVRERLQRELPVEMEILDAQVKCISVVGAPPRDTL